MTDPDGLASASDKPVFLDEVQRGRDPLVIAIKAEVDRHPRTRSQFVLAGSSRFTTVPKLSESLAGRARLIDLWPLSQGELAGGAERALDALFAPAATLRSAEPAPMTRADIFERVVAGGFPEIHQLPAGRLRAAWFADYARLLVQRDLADLRRVRTGVDLPRLLRMIAARTSQELNMAALARDLDLAKDTVGDYVSLLATIYLHRLVPAWSNSFTTRAKHHPKTHMVDSGLAAALLGLGVDRLRVPTAPMAGPLLESFVLGELVKQATWADTVVSIHHFRDREQREVDIVLETLDGRVVGLEVKAAQNVDETDVRHLAYLRDRVGDRFVNGIVLHLGPRPLPLGDRLTALPVSALWSVG